MTLNIFKSVKICFIFLFFIIETSHASSWTREKRETLFILESITSSNNFKYIYNSPKNDAEYFNKQETKLYGEYGLTQNLTLGGYFKLHSIKINNNQSGFETINKDKFAEIFCIIKLLQDKENKKIFSFRTAYARPLEYTKGKSERLNYAETRESLDLRILLGISNESSITNPYYLSNGYFMNFETGLKFLRDSFYNKFIFESTTGFKANQSSLMVFKYSFNYDYYQDSFFKKVGKKHSADYGQVIPGFRKENNYYLSDTSHKFKLSSIIHFDNSLSLEIGLYKHFGERINTEGFNVSFWFLL
jgi:hypothetical protein